MDWAEILHMITLYFGKEHITILGNYNVGMWCNVVIEL